MYIPSFIHVCVSCHHTFHYPLFYQFLRNYSEEIREKTDSTTISSCNNIVIKHYFDQRLKKKILKLGFFNIMECESWKKYKLNKDISISIVPQMSSNISGLPEQINYDLDTSIVILIISYY